MCSLGIEQNSHSTSWVLTRLLTYYGDENPTAGKAKGRHPACNIEFELPCIYIYILYINKHLSEHT